MYLFGRVPAYHRPCSRFDFRYHIKTAHSSMFVIPALGKGRKEKKIRSSRPFLLLYQIWGQPERNETLSLRKIVLSVLPPSLPLSPHLPVPLPSCSGSSFPCYIVWNCFVKGGNIMISVFIFLMTVRTFGHSGDYMWESLSLVVVFFCCLCIFKVKTTLF